MYFDFEDQIENNLTKIDALLRIVKGRKLLIAADTNSRSNTWHVVTTNSRGKKLEEFNKKTTLHSQRRK
jgi:hypothetical protein